uniref:RIMS-binding protein 2 n=1 Tax=Oncorhynchus tshawytscha TaxID=74940 RepID=A0AAZ3NXX3_ONCTS
MRMTRGQSSPCLSCSGCVSQSCRLVEEVFKYVSPSISLQRKSSVPETEEKVRRLRRKNTELAVIAKRLEDRAHKLQEANLKVVNYKPITVFRYSYCLTAGLSYSFQIKCYLSRELSKKRKECENLEHEVRKRQKKCLDLVRNPQGPSTRVFVNYCNLSVLLPVDQIRVSFDCLQHMREVAERRQQLELEHEQALAILKFKQDEIKRLQRAEFFAKREHEGVVQLLEVSLSKVRELEDKCRSQSEQFGLLSHELETFRLQAGKMDLAGSALLTNHALCHLTNGVGLAGGNHGNRYYHHVPDTCQRANNVIRFCLISAFNCNNAIRWVMFIIHDNVTLFFPSYNPYDGPNDNPEVELPLTAGEYIYVYGGMDDDGFYEGELMDGRRGLVPSNFVERVSDDDMMSAHVPEGTDISHNSLLDSSLHSASHQHHLRLGSPGTSERTDPTFAASNPGPLSVSFPSGEQVPAPTDPSLRPLLSPAPLTNGLDLDLEVGVDTVPYPRKLTLIKQLAKSIIIGWDGPLVPAGWGNVWSYNVYVDQELRLNVPFGSQTKAVLERLDVNLKAYRVSVQSLTERGSSDQLRCSMLVGRDVCVAPTQLRVDRVTATSASLSWLPSNSNYVHIVSLNEEEMELVKAGSYSLCLSNLTPSLHYTVKVEARPHQTPWELPQERREHKTATTTFTVLAAGPPDAPLDVQLEQGPSPGIALISWLPVTIDAAGTSNGVRVTGYTIYADKKKVLEVSSPTAGSALMGPSQIQSLMTAHQLTVRTMSGHGESTDSVPVNVPAKLAAIMTDQASATSAPCSLSPPVHQSPPPLFLLRLLYFPSFILEFTHCFDSFFFLYVTLHPYLMPPCPAQPSHIRLLPELLSPSPTSNPLPSTCDTLSSWEVPDSDEEILESILKLPPQAQAQHLFSIPEVTDEEDNSVDEDYNHRRHRRLSQARPSRTHLHPDDPHYHRTRDQPHHHHHHSSRAEAKEPLPRHSGGAVVRARPQHRVHYSMEPARPIGDNEVRIFVALFPYDPVNMSPNPDAAEEELPFREGQIIKIYGDKDSDGFYHGELNGRHGYVPCNMVSEIQVEDDETRETLLQQGFLSTHTNMEKIGRHNYPSQSGVAMVNPAGPVPRRMKAIFDYDPRESSPNADIEAELTFSAGDVIYVFGDMDDDGFFYGDLNGHKGLVPSNFLQAMPEAPRKAPPPDPQPPPLAEPRRELQVRLCTGYAYDTVDTCVQYITNCFMAKH